ncbi:FkbM family methyltransferase [Brachyspira pulli]|uniref:FkbM family methyltransferase n=1 Tax=Brachyspira pulli TaxID=310721 RepID=UPI0030078B25
MDNNTLNSFVWFIPFKSIRNFIREYVLDKDRQNNLINKKLDILNTLFYTKFIREKYSNDPKRLEHFSYKVFSQNDEDGILNEIFKRIGIKNKFFVEFGVQDGLECNSHFLLLQGWEGVFIEGSSEYCKKINDNFQNPIKKNKLKVINSFITAENINEILSTTKAVSINEIDLLSIDIDGNDYHVFNAINVINPRVVVIEYNGKFPPPIKWCMPYNPNYVWDYSDNQGASLEAIVELAESKGYKLVATNISGVNAFFIKKELYDYDKFTNNDSISNLYNPPQYDIKFQSGHNNIRFLQNHFDI